VHRGIGLASFIEVTNPSAAFYGVGGARISSQDGATVRLDATGGCSAIPASPNRAGDRIRAGAVRPTSFGVPIERVRVITGDTDNTPYGGATWASRAAGIGGEAAWQAGKALRENCSPPPPRFCRPTRRRSISAPASWSMPTAGASAWASMSGPRRLFPPILCRPLPGRIRGNAPLCAARLAVRLHQRVQASYLRSTRAPAR